MIKDILKLKDLKGYAGIKVSAWGETATTYLYILNEDPNEVLKYYVFDSKGKLMPATWPVGKVNWKYSPWPRATCNNTFTVIDMVNRDFREYELITLDEVKKTVFMAML